MNQLKPFQTAGVEYMKSTFRCILADEMGLGKTVQVAGLINTCPGIQRVLIVCPASLKGNWHNELNAWLTRPLSIQILSGRTCDIEPTDITIVNYDILSAHTEALLSGKADSKGHIWDLVVFDEAHYLKSISAERTKAARIVAPSAARLVFLTGTPLVNKPADLFVMLNAIDSEQFKSKQAFEIRYCNGHNERLKFGSKIVYRWNNFGATNIPELRSRLAPLMLRRLKADVLKDLPEKFHQVIEIDAADMFRDVGLSGEWWNEVEHVSVSATAQARKACGLDKVKAVATHVEMLFQEKNKVILFGYHKDVIAALAEKLVKYNPVVITGETPANKRTDLVKAFQESEKCRLFIGNIMAAGVGLTLTASDIVVFAELDWVPGNMKQAEDRAHRIGQKNNVLIQYLVAPGIDAEIGRALARKIEVIEQTIGGP